MTKIQKKLKSNKLTLGKILTINGYTSYSKKGYTKYGYKHQTFSRCLNGINPFTEKTFKEWRELLRGAGYENLFDDSDYEITQLKYKAK